MRTNSVTQGFVPVNQFKTSVSFASNGQSIRFLGAREAVMMMRDKYNAWGSAVLDSADPMKYKPMLMEPGKVQGVARLVADSSQVDQSEVFLRFMVCLEMGLHLKIYEAINRIENREDAAKFVKVFGDFYRQKIDGFSSSIEQCSELFRYRMSPSVSVTMNFGNHNSKEDIGSYQKMVAEIHPQIIVNENGSGRFTETFISGKGAVQAGTNPEFDRLFDESLGKGKIKIIELEQMPPDEQAAYYTELPMHTAMPKKVRQLVSEGKIDEAYELNCRVVDSYWPFCGSRHRAFASNFREFIDTLPLFCPELKDREKINIFLRYGSMHRDLLGLVHEGCPEIKLDEFIDSSVLGFSIYGMDRAPVTQDRERSYLTAFLGNFPIGDSDERMSLARLLLFTENASLDLLRGLPEKGDVYDAVNVYVDGLASSQNINPDNAEAFLRQRAVSYPDISSWLDACSRSGNMPELNTSSVAWTSSPEKIDAFKKRMSAFEINKSTKYAERIILFKYNLEGLATEEVTAVLKSLGFELISGSWIRTKEKA